MPEYLTTTHYSGLTLHRKCPMAWTYRYEFRLRRPPEAGPAPALHFGSWWGALRSADVLERGRRLGSLVGKPRSFGAVDGVDFDMVKVTKREVYERAARWWSEQPDDHQEAFVKNIGEPLVQRLQGAYERWEAQWGSDTRYERPLGVEVFWKRPLPRPKADEAWGDSREGLPDMSLLGYIDELYEDTQRGIVVVRDNKTSKQLSVMGTSLDDMMDSQLQLYAWGVGPQCHEWGIARPTAIAYDRIQSVKPTSPRLTDTTGKLSAATSRYDLQTYLEWARTDTATGAVIEYVKTPEFQALTAEQQQQIEDLPKGRLWGKIGAFYADGKRPKFGIYHEEDEVIAHLSQPSWISQFLQRTLTPVNRNLVTAHLRAAVDTATDIWRTQRRAEVTFEAPRNLSSSNCGWCDFQSLCRAQMVGGSDGTYDLREHKLLGPEGRVLLEAGVTTHGED